MKKFNFKLLMVTVMVLVLLVSLIACNPKEKTPENPPSNTNNSPYAEPIDANNPTDVFFTELYNITHDIGSEKIEANQNVYVEADLGIELGNRAVSAVASDDHKFNITVKLQAMLDRTGDGANTQLGLNIGVGSKPLIYMCYVPSEKIAYMQVGGQKVKVNTSLIPLGTLIDNALGEDVIKDGANLGSVDSFLNEALGKGEDWSLDNFISALVTQFKLADQMKGLVGALPAGLGNQFLDRNGALSVRRLLGNSIVQSLFTATKSAADSEGYETHTAKLVADSDSLVGGMLGTGENVGDLDVAISFKSKNHSVKDGVKVSADFVVDENNALYSSLKTVEGAEGADPVVLHPYLELNINHLKVRKAGTSAIGLLVSDEAKADYKDNLQININEHFEFPGIVVAGNLLPKIDLVVKAKLDLMNPAETNTTQLRAYLSTTTTTKKGQYDFTLNTTNYTYSDDDPKYTLDLTYAQGRLSLTIDRNSALVPAYADMTCIYGFVASPIGNLIQGILEGVDTKQAQEFAKRYWNHVYDDEGNDTGALEWNKNFKAFVVDNVSVNNLLGLVGIGNAATAADEAPETEEVEPVKSYNLFNGIVTIFTMLSKGQDDVTIGVKGLLPAICDIANNFGASLEPTPALKAVEDMINNTSFSIVTTALTFEGGKGGNFLPRLQWLLLRDEFYPDDVYTEEEDNLKLRLYYTDNGVNWDLTFYGANDPDAANGENRKVGIVYHSVISFGEPETINKLDLAEYEAAKQAYDNGISDAKHVLETAQADFDAKDAALTEATAPYEATQAYKDWQAAVAEYTEAKAAIASGNAGNLWNELKKADGTPYGTYFTPTLGVVSGTTANGLWRIGSTVANNRNYRGWTSPLLLWVEAGEKEDGVEREKLNTIITNIQNLVENKAELSTELKTRYKNAIAVGGELFNAMLRECKAAIENDRTDAANKATPEYSAYNTAKSNQSAAKTTLTNAQKAVAALEDPYFAYYYWDITRV